MKGRRPLNYVILFAGYIGVDSYMDSYFLQCSLFIVTSVTYFGARSMILGVSPLSLP